MLLVKTVLRQQNEIVISPLPKYLNFLSPIPLPLVPPVYGQNAQLYLVDILAYQVQKSPR